MTSSLTLIIGSFAAVMITRGMAASKGDLFTILRNSAPFMIGMNRSTSISAGRSSSSTDSASRPLPTQMAR